MKRILALLLIAVISAAGVLACGALPRTGKVPADVPEDLQPVEDTGFSFSASPDLPLPNESEEVPQGQPFTFGGIVYSDTPILEVTALITSSDGPA